MLISARRFGVIFVEHEHSLLLFGSVPKNQFGFIVFLLRLELLGRLFFFVITLAAIIEEERHFLGFAVKATGS